MPAAKKKSKTQQFRYQKTRANTFHHGVPIGKSKKIVAWTHSHLDTDLLASLGFFYQPTLQHKDQIQCFCCSKKAFGFKGLSEDQVLDQFDCNYSRLMKFIRAKEADYTILNDPKNSKSVEIRLSTFTDFPHSKPSADSLSASGFIFTPSTIDDDSTTCIYCQCILDGWDEHDDPFEEHKARNNECKIFDEVDSADFSSLEGSRLASPIKVSETVNPLSDDDFDNAEQKSQRQNFQALRPKNRYGTSKIRKNKIVTSTNNSSSFLENSQQKLTSSQRRSWYRDDNEKKRKSDELLSDDDDFEHSPRKQRPLIDGDSLMEISAIEDDNAVETKINGETVQDIINSTFIPPSMPQSPVKEIESTKPLQSPVREKRSPKKKSNQVALPQKRLPTRRSLRSSDVSDKIVSKTDILDAISDSASSQAISAAYAEAEVFDHHNDDMILELSKGQNHDSDLQGKDAVSDAGDMEVGDSLVLQEPETVSTKAINSEDKKTKKTTRSDVFLPKTMENLDMEAAESNESSIGRRTRRAKAQAEVQDDHKQISSPHRRSIELMESPERTATAEPMTDVSLVGATKSSGNLDRLSIAERIEEENRTVYADRRRTRSSLAPYSPPKAVKEVEVEEKPDATLVKKPSRTKSTKRNSTTSSVGKNKAKDAPKFTNSRVKKEKTTKRRQKKGEVAEAMEIVDNDLKEAELSSHRESQVSTRRGTSNSGSLIGSPDAASKPSRARKRMSLMRMMRERSSKLFNSSSQREDSYSDSKEQIRSKEKARESISITKSPGKSPLKLNKLIDADSDDDIFSRSSPLRAAKRKEKGYGIDKIVLEIGKDIISDAPSLSAPGSMSPKIERSASPFPHSLPTPVDPVEQEMKIVSDAIVSAQVPENDAGDDSADDVEDSQKVTRGRSTGPRRILSNRSSKESLKVASGSPGASSSRKSSQRPSLRLSILPQGSPGKQQLVRSPINTARFEISHIDDDVILADDDIKSSEDPNRFVINEKTDFEESSRRTSKIKESENNNNRFLSSPVKTAAAPAEHSEESIRPMVDVQSDQNLRIPGVIAEFNEDSDNTGDNDTATHHVPTKTPNTLSVQHLPMKSSTPLNLAKMDAESTPLDVNPRTSLDLAPNPDKESVSQKLETVPAGADLSDTSENFVDAIGTKKESPDSTKNDEAQQSKGLIEDQAEVEWTPSETTLFSQIIGDIETSGEFLSKITNSQYDSLNDDLDGELTSFISQMPDDELEMTVKDWIMHNAKQARSLLDLNLSQMIGLFKSEGDRALQVLENLPMKDDDHDDD